MTSSIASSTAYSGNSKNILPLENKHQNMTICHLGEFGLLKELFKKLPKPSSHTVCGVGDDAAVIDNGKTYLLATCDTQTAGVHFLSNAVTPESIGQKAVAITTSDIAAMGGTPRHLLISIMTPNDMSVDFLTRLYDGFRIGCDAYGIDIIGGNTSRGSSLSINLFLLGDIEKELLLTRKSARPGDLVVVTGTLGDSAAGLEILKHNLQYEHTGDALEGLPAIAALKRLQAGARRRCTLLSHHTNPTARVAEGQAIAKTKLATSMIDISDGLSSDISHICDESNVGVELSIDTLPISKELKAYCKVINIPAWDYALNGGEDYELLFTVPASKFSTFQKQFSKESKTPITVIGKILPKNSDRFLVFPDRKKVPLSPGGWDHFT